PSDLQVPDRPDRLPHAGPEHALDRVDARRRRPLDASHVVTPLVEHRQAEAMAADAPHGLKDAVLGARERVARSDVAGPGRRRPGGDGDRPGLPREVADLHAVDSLPFARGRDHVATSRQSAGDALTLTGAPPCSVVTWIGPRDSTVAS